MTTFSPKGWKEYARHCVSRMAAFWPCQIYLYYEGKDPGVTASPGLAIGDVLRIDGIKDFLAMAQEHGKPEEGYRWDAARFCYKVFAVTDAALRCETKWLVWLDADVETSEPVPASFFQRYLRDDKAVVYLGRPWWDYSECGFVAYNLEHPKTPHLLGHFRQVYEEGTIWSMKEWHDSYVFDQVRKGVLDEGEDLSISHPKHRNIHVWPTSPLASFCEHHKGPRKGKIPSS